MKLNSKEILGNDNITFVKVYDGDVDYRPCGTSVNYAYYFKDGKRHKCRQYNQYTSLVARTKEGSRFRENSPNYKSATLSEDFNTFDKFIQWAETQHGFMCVSNTGRLWQLDKDLFGNGESVYSPKTVCFLPDQINSSMNALRYDDFWGHLRLFNLVYDDYFSHLDDLVLEKFFTLSKSDYTLSRHPKISQSEYEDKLKLKEELNDISSVVSFIKSYITDENMYKNISFKDGFYFVKMNRFGKTYSEKFKCVRQAMGYRFECEYDSIECLREQYKHSAFYNNIEDIVLTYLEDIKNREDICLGEDSKLKQWIQVEV